MKLARTLFAFAAMLAASTAFAGHGDQGAVLDHQILVKMHLSNIHEIEASTLALEKSTNKAVQDFAQHLIDDHTAADAEIEALAETHDLQLTQLAETMPAAIEMQSKHETLMAKLESLSGAEFDLKFVKAQVKAHEKAITSLEEALPSLELTDVASHVEMTLPILKTHLEEAKALKEELTAE